MPVPGGHFEWELMEIGIIYALLLLILAVLVFFVNQRRALRILSGIGFIPSFLAKFWHHAFLFTFGWQYFGTGHMQRGPTWWILPWVMPVLLLISFLDLDTSDASQPRHVKESIIA